MVRATSNPDYGLDNILEEPVERLHGFRSGSIYTLEDIESTRYVIFPAREPLQDFSGIHTISAAEIHDILEQGEEFPLMRTLDMSIERANTENSRGGNLLVGKIDRGELSDMGYALEHGRLLTVWPYSRESDYR